MGNGVDAANTNSAQEREAVHDVTKLRRRVHAHEAHVTSVCGTSVCGTSVSTPTEAVGRNTIPGLVKVKRGRGGADWRSGTLTERLRSGILNSVYAKVHNKYEE